MQAAHHGMTIVDEDGEPEGVPPAVFRAKALRAYRRYELDVAAGRDAEESVEAEAGALLEAESQCDTHDLREMVKAYFEAQGRS